MSNVTDASFVIAVTGAVSAVGGLIANGLRGRRKEAVDVVAAWSSTYNDLLATVQKLQTALEEEREERLTYEKESKKTVRQLEIDLRRAMGHVAYLEQQVRDAGLQIRPWDS